MSIEQIAVSIAASVVWSVFSLRLSGAAASAVALLLIALQSTGVGLNPEAVVGGLLANGALWFARGERLGRVSILLGSAGAGACVVAGSNFILYLLIGAVLFNGAASAYRRAWLVPSSRELRSRPNPSLIAIAALTFVFGRASWGFLLLVFAWTCNRWRILFLRPYESSLVIAGVLLGVLSAFAAGAFGFVLPSLQAMIDALGTAPLRLAQSFCDSHPHGIGWVCLFSAGGALAAGFFGRGDDAYRSALVAVALAFVAGLTTDFIALRVVLNVALGLSVSRASRPLPTALLLLPIMGGALLDAFVGA